MYAEGSAAPCLGVPGALGEQAHWSARSCGAHPRTDEHAKCARLADVARLSVAHTELAALTVHGQENIRAADPMNLPEVSRDQRLAIFVFNRRIFISPLPRNSAAHVHADLRKKSWRFNRQRNHESEDKGQIRFVKTLFRSRIGRNFRDCDRTLLRSQL